MSFNKRNNHGYNMSFRPNNFRQNFGNAGLQNQFQQNGYQNGHQSGYPTQYQNNNYHNNYRRKNHRQNQNSGGNSMNQYNNRNSFHQNNNFNNNYNHHHNHHYNHQSNHHHHHHNNYIPPPVPQQYNKPDPNFKEVSGAAFFIGQLDKTVNRDTVYNEIIRHSKQAAKGQGFYVRRMCMPTANSSTGTGNCGFAIVHTRSAEEANYVLRLGKLRIAGKDCQVQPYADRRSKKDSGDSKGTGCLKKLLKIK